MAIDSPSGLVEVAAGVELDEHPEAQAAVNVGPPCIGQLSPQARVEPAMTTTWEADIPLDRIESV